MIVSNDLVKHLRQITGSSITLCKKALEENAGDMDKALASLKKSSEALADKKSGRSTGVGLVETYLHNNKKVGVLVEIRCETDFVARNAEFQAFAHDIALHIAGAKPLYVRADAISDEARAEAKRLFSDEAASLGKSPEMTAKIIEGKLQAHFSDVSLMSQSFVKDSTLTVEDFVKRAIGHFGEKIEIVRFARYEV